MTESNRRLTDFDSFWAELNVQFFNPSSIKMYEILPLHHSNTVLLDIPSRNRSWSESGSRVSESPVTKKKKIQPTHRQKLFLAHWASSCSFLSSYSMFSMGFCNKTCKYVILWGFFHNNHIALRKNGWPSTSAAMPTSPRLQDEAPFSISLLLALLDRDSLFNFTYNHK